MQNSPPIAPTAKTPQPEAAKQFKEGRLSKQPATLHSLPLPEILVMAMFFSLLIWGVIGFWNSPPPLPPLSNEELQALSPEIKAELLRMREPSLEFDQEQSSSKAARNRERAMLRLQQEPYNRADIANAASRLKLREQKEFLR
jgi:hypothetical protein